MDDTHTLAISVNATTPDGQRTPRMEGNWASGQTELHPNGTGWYNRFQCVADQANDYLIDREEQKTKTYAGLQSIFIEDQAVTASMGKIVDRTKERLGTSDQMIIRTRQRLIKAARALMEGQAPPEVDHPEYYAVRSGGAMLPIGVDWVEATKELRKGFIEHPELDLSVIGGVPAV